MKVKLERILGYTDSVNMDAEDSLELVKDSVLFDLEDVDGFIRPKDYTLTTSGEGHNLLLRDLSDRDLNDYLDLLIKDLDKLDKLAMSYTVYKDDFSLEVLIRIIEREIFSRSIIKSQSITASM